MAKCELCGQDIEPGKVVTVQATVRYKGIPGIAIFSVCQTCAEEALPTTDIDALAASHMPMLAANNN